MKSSSKRLLSALILLLRSLRQQFETLIRKFLHNFSAYVCCCGFIYLQIILFARVFMFGPYGIKLDCVLHDGRVLDCMNRQRHEGHIPHDTKMPSRHFKKSGHNRTIAHQQKVIHKKQDQICQIIIILRFYHINIVKNHSGFSTRKEIGKKRKEKKSTMFEEFVDIEKSKRDQSTLKLVM